MYGLGVFHARGISIPPSVSPAAGDEMPPAQAGAMSPSQHVRDAAECDSDLLTGFPPCIDNVDNGSPIRRPPMSWRPGKRGSAGGTSRQGPAQSPRARPRLGSRLGALYAGCRTRLSAAGLVHIRSDLASTCSPHSRPTRIAPPVAEQAPKPAITTSAMAPNPWDAATPPSRLSTSPREEYPRRCTPSIPCTGKRAAVSTQRHMQFFPARPKVRCRRRPS